MKSFSKDQLWSLIRDVPDFPKPGILFKDVCPLLEAGALSSVVEELVAQLEGIDFEGIACIESRGFLFGAPLAAKLGKSLYLVRKKGKLPPPTNSVFYDLEYGKDTLEMRASKDRVVIVDDVLATGGTMRAAAELVEKGGGVVAATLVLIDLKSLNTFEWRGAGALSVFCI